MVQSTKNLALAPIPKSQQELLKFLDINFKRITDMFLQQLIGGDLADNSVETNHIVNGTIITEDIANLAITTSLLADLAVTAAKLAVDAVETAKIKNANVTLAKLAADIFDATNPANAGGTAAPGIASTLSHRDHIHNIIIANNMTQARALIQAGVISVTHSAQVTKNTLDNAFPTAFSAAPLAVVANADVSRSDVACTTGGFTTTNFDLTTRSIDAASISDTFDVYWIAIGPGA